MDILSTELPQMPKNKRTAPYDSNERQKTSPSTIEGGDFSKGTAKLPWLFFKGMKGQTEHTS